MAIIADQYEALRTKLVDISNRNNMLNFRLAKTHGVQVVGENPDQVFQRLQDISKAMSFRGRPDREGEEGAAKELPLGDATSNAAPVDQSDSVLNTPHLSSTLETRLLKSFRESHLIQQETGLNVLFLAFGALYWRESESSQDERAAPLIFLPVALERLPTGKFNLRYTGEDVGTNLSLHVKLEQDFGIKVPDLDEGGSIREYAEAVQGCVADQKTWRVDSESIWLSFFQFSKLVMYKDLEESQWPEGSLPTQHPDVVALLGGSFTSSPSTPSEDEPVDPYRPISACREIYNCDSSQALAIIRAQTGQSMVIEGPPGTGKSQTIVNLISEMIAAGKKVLFVSEKMAALDVVARKLDEAGLKDIGLELHSKQSTRKSFYGELRRVMGLKGSLEDADAEANRLTSLRDRLNDYSSAVNEPVLPWGITPHEAIGLASALPPERPEDIPFRISFDSLRAFTWQQMQTLLPQVQAYQDRLKEIGVPSQHPFYGVNLRVLTPMQRTQIQSTLQQALDQWPDAIRRANTLAERLCLPKPERPSDSAVLSACAKRAVEAPVHDGVAVRLSTWESAAPAVKDTIQNLTRLQEILTERSSLVSEHIWNSDITAALPAYEKWAGRWWRSISPEFRRRSKGLKALLLSPSSLTPPEQLELLRDVAEIQRLRGAIEQGSELMAQLFGAQWQGERTDPIVLTRLLEWCLCVRSDVANQQVPASLLDFFEASFDASGLATEAQECAQAVQQAVETTRSLFSQLQYPVTQVDEKDMETTFARLHTWQDNFDRVQEMCSLVIAAANLQDVQLGEVVKHSATWPNGAELLCDSLIRSYTDGILSEAMHTRPALQNYTRSEHEQALKDFRKIDDLILVINRAKVRAAHLAGLPGWEGIGGNLSQVRRQTELQRPSKSIRWALETAGPAIQQIKPLFLMSPLSVSQFLPRDLRCQFDVVIFDEASQIKPEDALPAILRGKQTIVVGDSKQMPPTSFFDKMAADDGSDDDADAAVTSIGQLESILALMASVVRGTSRSSDLRWHYRSKHPDLIRPSNEFYDHGLVIFPHPSFEGKNEKTPLGLRWHYDRSHIYDRGGSGVNRAQAMAVAQTVISHVSDPRAPSLGVAAFSKQQQAAIEDALELLRAEHPQVLEAFDEAHPFERLFVKNLETIQGDERDVIFISVGYGPDEHGYVAMNFGPVNKEGGERRLNVLMSRARFRCEVFSSITASDIRLSDAPGRGVSVLKRFLQFAQTGELDDPKPSGRGVGSEFEAQVARELQAHGYEVDMQVGSIGFYIDLAVRHRQKPGRYVLGIECDGASYHSAKSARDRDKLRQMALEVRGWKLHRIWSTDWWQSREGEVQRCIEAIERAHAADAPEPPTVSDAASAPKPEDFIKMEAPGHIRNGPKTVPYVAWSEPIEQNGVPIQIMPDSRLAYWIAQIARVEAPIHEALLCQRMRTSAGLGRAGRRVQRAVEQALHAAVAATYVRRKGSFVYLFDGGVIIPRDRSSLPAQEKRSEWVAPEELRAAVVRGVDVSCGMSKEDAARSAWQMLGFSRCLDAMVDAATTEILALLQDGALVELDGLLRLPADA